MCFDNHKISMIPTASVGVSATTSSVPGPRFTLGEKRKSTEAPSNSSIRKRNK